MNEFSRTELLIGKKALDKLANSKVAIFGIGGVGTFAVEGLVRAGVGKLALVDDDRICVTNINRQIHATWKTVGKPKVEVMRDRILEINPRAEVTIHQTFYNEQTGEELVRKDYDCIVDAIDTVSGKLDLIERATRLGIPIISCMGAGNKLDPSRLEVSDISETSVCPLAKVMRRELKKRGITSLKVVYSREEALKPMALEESSCETCRICPEAAARSGAVRRQIPGSISFVPSVAGLLIASEVVRDLIKNCPRE